MPEKLEEEWEEIGPGIFVAALSKQDVGWGPGFGYLGREGGSVQASAVW